MVLGRADAMGTSLQSFQSKERVRRESAGKEKRGLGKDGGGLGKELAFCGQKADFCGKEKCIFSQ